jgi:hypothetical protein
VHSSEASHRLAQTVNRWLLVRGRGERPLDRLVDPESIRAHSSSKRPSVQLGDLAILYAAVWQALYGVVEVVSDPEHDPTRDRWAWRFAIRPLAVVGDLHEAPPVEAAGVFPQSIWRHSHIRLTPERFGAARDLVTSASQAGSGPSNSSQIRRDRYPSST